MTENESVVKERLLSLDLFRGLTVATMILVNNPGSWDSIYPILRHAKWNGCTLADLVFPFFLFIVGVSIYLSFAQKKNYPKEKIILKIFRRSVILFILGLILSGFPDYKLNEIRIPGVLQRIAVVYFFSSILFLFLNLKQIWIIFFGILIFYAGLFLLIPPPDQTTPTLEPEKNIAAYIDRLFLSGHLWKFTKTWDPEGILSTLSAIATSLSGIVIGPMIEKSPATEYSKSKVCHLVLLGVTFLFLGLIIDSFFPINKNLWTSSYVLFTSGLAMLCFAFLQKLTEKKQSKLTRLFQFLFGPFGQNALILYFFSGIFARILGIVKIETKTKSLTLKNFIYVELFGQFTNANLASLCFSFALLFLLFLLGFLLYRLKIIIKI